MKRLTDSRVANLAASGILADFDVYRVRFRELTRRAGGRFEQADWHGVHADAVERLELYRAVLGPAVAAVTELLGDRLDDRVLWAGMKAVYSGLIADRDDWELAETFFNSVTRRLFATVGVDPRIEFVNTDFDAPPTSAKRAVYRTYRRARRPQTLVRAILADTPLAESLEDPERDAIVAGTRIEAHLLSIGALKVIDRAEVVRHVFYRGKGAYVIGQLFSGSHRLPIVLALVQDQEKTRLHALLLDESPVSILFSFARSYFHVDTDRPWELARFLQVLMPRKRIAELYISLGFNKHGKTELYRDLLRHLASSEERFEATPGTRGLVMIVFGLPGHDLVFKVIRDRIPPSKRVTRRTVVDKYGLVFKHDRAGRLVDAQEFEHLELALDRFDPELLQWLVEEAGSTVRVEGKRIVIRHAYVERRVVPLDIYVREAGTDAAKAAMIEYGDAIKDLAATGIFPGDMLLKNFGVTRHGRVVFYDYDELCLLTECRFRAMPRFRDDDEVYSAEPLFTVYDGDMFPEEFGRFLGVTGELREAFIAEHGELFTPGYWSRIQDRIAAGDVLDIFPYRPDEHV